jgi:hypothetical protein
MWRVKLIKLVTFIGGAYFFLRFILPSKVSLPLVEGTFSFDSVHQEIVVGITAMVLMSIGLGIINLLMTHGQKLSFMRQGWFYSAVLLFGLFSMFYAGFASWKDALQSSMAVKEINTLAEFSKVIVRDVEAEVRSVEAKAIEKDSVKNNQNKKVFWERNQLLKEAIINLISNNRILSLKDQQKSELEEQISSLAILETTDPEFKANHELAHLLSRIATLEADHRRALEQNNFANKLYSILFNGLFVPLGSAMFALLGFYVASAAYRAFRVKSLEAGLLVFTALLVILGQVPLPLGESTDYIAPHLAELRSWLLTIPNSAAFRAITVGASVGILVMAFRMWLSIESSSFSGSKNK